MEPGGKTAGVIGIECIAIGRKNKEREDWELGNEFSWMFFLFLDN